MNYYEHTLIARQDTSPSQIKQLQEKYSKIIESNKGNILKFESWGLMHLSYLIKKNKKGNYIHFKIEGNGKTIEELESQYNNLDPWQYETNPDDIYRKKFYLTVLSDLNSDNWKRALDIGAGEGFITRDLPADEIHAIESSDQAASRLPENVKRVYEPQGKYDLIICTGTLYEPYDHKKIYNNIIKSSCKTILILLMNYQKKI